MRDAIRRAKQAGRELATFDDLRQAYELDRMPSENAMAAAFIPGGVIRKPTEPAEPEPDFSDAKSDDLTATEGGVNEGCNRLKASPQAIRRTTASELVTG